MIAFCLWERWKIDGTLCFRQTPDHQRLSSYLEVKQWSLVDKEHALIDVVGCNYTLTSFWQLTSKYGATLLKLT